MQRCRCRWVADTIFSSLKFRSSHWQIFFKRVVLKHLAKIHTNASVLDFLVKFLRTPFFTEHFRWLLLHGHEFKLLGFLVFWTRWRYFKISWQSGSKQLTKDLVLLWFQGFIHRTWNLKKKILLKLILSDAKRPRTSTTSLRYFF